MTGRLRGTIATMVLAAALALTAGCVSFYDDQGTLAAPTYTPSARELLAAAEIDLPPSASEPELTVPNVSPTRFRYAYRVEFTIAEQDVPAFAESLRGVDRCGDIKQPCDLSIQDFSALGVAPHQPSGSLYRRDRVETTARVTYVQVLMVGPDRTTVYVAVSN